MYAPYADTARMPESSKLEYVSELRRREDEEFVSAIGGRIRLAELNLKDAPLRLQCDVSEVCNMRASPHDWAIPCIRQAMDAWVRTRSGPADCGLILPLALGHHVDHCVVRDAALPFAASLPSAFYEDLPYAIRPGAQEERLRFCDEMKTQFVGGLSSVSCDADKLAAAEKKRRLISAYRSQVECAQRDEIAEFSNRYRGAERMWVNRAWLKIAGREGLSANQKIFETVL